MLLLNLRNNSYKFVSAYPVTVFSLEYWAYSICNIFDEIISRIMSFCIINLFQAIDINKADSKKDRDDWAAPAEYILLLADSLEDVFFSDKNYITTDYAVLSQRMTGQDSQGYSYYYYSFDLSTLLTYQLREKHQKDTLRLTMVPVTAEYATSSSGTSSLSAVKQAQTISNTIFSSPNNSQTPMQLEVIYSGF